MSVVLEPAFENETTGEIERIRKKLDANRDEFLALADAISNERWAEKAPSCDWTCGEVLVHLTWALEQLPAEIRSAQREQGMFNYPKRIADPLSYWYTRWLARNETRQSVSRRYSAGITAALAAIDEVPEDAWSKGARFYGERFYTVADLCETPIDHFAAHTAGMVDQEHLLSEIEV